MVGCSTVVRTWTKQKVLIADYSVWGNTVTVAAKPLKTETRPDILFVSIYAAY
jgi:hypothetical protein